ncbi:LapA family protein [Chelativorans sp. AA-79]|uniref:LapA family protein n=1 Tax=Chelativorans sp. AA-79 TaxID=3028735 RepID=UPI0023F9950C|nr:LapA family protein [Chelativorans sp. AA-79]WEX09550.1 LapA family protein [Chelativorans sp. AA-79]
MLNRAVLVLIIVPLAIILIALAVANRALMPFTIDPFNPGNPGLTVEMPLFVYLFLAMILGMIIGGAVTWFRQGRYRRLARERASEIERLRTRAAPEASTTALLRTDA